MFGPAVGPAVPIDALNVAKPKRGGAKKGTLTLASMELDNVSKVTEPAKARRKRMHKKSKAIVSEDPLDIDADTNSVATKLEGPGTEETDGKGNGKSGGRSGTRSSTKSAPLPKTSNAANADPNAEAGCGPEGKSQSFFA